MNNNENDPTKQVKVLLKGIIKCSRCEKKANSMINDVAYCATCWDTYYAPNQDLLENYQNVQKSLHFLNLIELTEKDLLSPANQLNLEKGVLYLNYVLNRLNEAMKNRKLIELKET